MRGRESRAPSQRQLRVGEELRHVLAHVLERGDLRDPGLAGVTVTVTEVRVSPDLRNATAYVVPLGGGAAEDVLGALARARPYLRRKVADAVGIDDCIEPVGDDDGSAFGEDVAHVCHHGLFALGVQ